MAAAVRIDSTAFVDPRFEVLGRMLGTSRFDALGRMASVWGWCTERSRYDIPTFFLAAFFPGEASADLVIAAELGEWSGCQETESHPIGCKHLRVKGTGGRIEWLAERRAASKAGGEANKRRIEAGRQAKGEPSGYPEAKPKGSPLSPAPAPSLVPRDQNSEPPIPPKGGRSRLSRGTKPPASEPTESEWPVVERVLGKLSEAAGVNYASRRAGKPTSAVKFILRRLREDVSEDELRMVVRHRSLEWGHKPDMREHLTAETIFGREKFDTYLAKAQAALDGSEPRAGPSSTDPPSPMVLELLRGGSHE